MLHSYECKHNIKVHSAVKLVGTEIVQFQESLPEGICSNSLGVQRATPYHARDEWPHELAARAQLIF